MNQLRDEIKASMREVAVDADGRRSAVFLFQPDFIGFQGHFPDRAVLPGICKILATLILCEACGAVAYRLQEVRSAKFMAPVGCGEEVRVDCRMAPEDDGGTRVHAKFRRGQDVVARLELRVVPDSAEVAS